MNKKRETSREVVTTDRVEMVHKDMGRGYLRTEVPEKSRNLNNYSVSTKNFVITKIARSRSA